MTQFAYYLPGDSAIPDDARIESLGLSLVLGAGRAANPVTGGPDGAHGVIVSAEVDSSYYRPEVQRWEKVGDYWVGMDRTSPPGPIDLRRESMVPGETITMADGSEWVCPTWRLLPRVYSVFRPADEWPIMARYRWLEQRAALVMDAKLGESILSDRDAMIIAVECLRVNYRVWLPEMSMLESIDSLSAVRILECLIGGYARPSALRREMVAAWRGGANVPGLTASEIVSGGP